TVPLCQRSNLIVRRNCRRRGQIICRDAAHACPPASRRTVDGALLLSACVFLGSARMLKAGPSSTNRQGEYLRQCTWVRWASPPRRPCEPQGPIATSVYCCQVP